MSYYVYILTNKVNTALYIGVTNNLERRVYEHRNTDFNIFTKRYKIHKLVYFEEYKNINDAIAREKQLKNWHRDWKFNLIKETNPQLLEMLK